MKKLFSILLAAILVLSCAMSASADVIFEPNDDFYETHASECPLLERYFIVSEAVHSLNEPGGELTMCNLKEGQEIYISNTYTDSSGIVWGLIQFSDASGWVPMGYLEVIYDEVSFAEEFGAQFSKETDDLRIADDSIDSLVFWKYPGSESFYATELWNDSYRDISFAHSYTDENGVVWGYVGYFYGCSGWVCIEDPDSTDASAILERENAVLYPDSVLDDDSLAEKGGLSPIWIAAILVAAVCAVTAVLILVLTRKKTA